MKKSIRDFDLNGKKVIIRVDFNVPIKDGKILDDNRIKESLNTIKYAIDNNAKVILMSHLGRIKDESDKFKNDLHIVSKRLTELLNKEVIFVPDTRGSLLEDSINSLNCGDVLLMQNTRYEDLDGKKESGNDDALGKYWASLGDIFINDAFGTSHRSHASNVGISKYLESGIGFLIEKELDNLSKCVENYERPYAVILGGAKVSDKIGVISSLVEKSDYILIGGGMAYTFLSSLGFNIGSSLLDKDSISFCADMLDKYKDKIILPIDSITSTNIDNVSNVKEKLNSEFEFSDMGLDIGSKTIDKFKEILSGCKTVFWNGPVGCFEVDEFSNGTKEILKFLSTLDCYTIIGGGDTASAAINFGYKDSFSHISTGGGASLELLEGKVLPGIDAIENKYEENF